jgi:hypothetical protein
MTDFAASLYAFLHFIPQLLRQEANFWKMFVDKN